MNSIDTILSINLFGEVEAINSKTFGFNPNILEANVINIVILLSGVIYLGRNFLTSALGVRQQKIVEAIEEAEERLNQASLRLSESEKQLSQSKTIIEQIKREAELTARKVKENILAQGKLDIERLTNSGKNTIEKTELQIKRQLQEHITNLALIKVTNQLREIMNPTMQSNLIDSNISQLGGQYEF